MAIWHRDNIILENLIEFDKKMKQALAAMGLPSLFLHDNLGIKFIEMGEDYLKASMPVDERTRQPFGILHGGVSCALADTVIGYAGSLCVNHETHSVVALDLHTTHIRSVSSGLVTATARPIYFGKSIQVWEAKTVNEQEKLIGITRITLFVKSKNTDEK